MIQLTTLDDSANQNAVVVLGDNSSVVFTFVYRPTIKRWTFGVEYATKPLTLNGLMLSVHPNILRACRDVLPFGLAVVSNDGADPFDIGDFASRRIRLFVLDNTAGSSEVDAVEADIFGGA